MMWGSDGWGWGVLMMVSSWLILAVLIAVLVWAVLRATSRAEPQERSTHALNILAERFARGEIDEEEYERRSRTLRQGGG